MPAGCQSTGVYGCPNSYGTMWKSNLLRAGLAVFALGVGLNYFGGAELRTVALVTQVAGAALLFVNAARSRRDETDGAPGPDE